MKPFVKAATGFLLTVFSAILIASLFDLPMPIVVGFFLLMSLVAYKPKGATTSIVVELWVNYIIERFFKDNAFLKLAFDDSQYVVQGRVIHIPQIGAKPNVQKNRSVFPGVSVRRTDTDIVYALDEYSTDPQHIPNIDQVQISFSKQDSVLGDMMAVLNEYVAEDMLDKWASNSTVVKTTGANASGGTTTVPPVTGQTGTRKAFTQRDLKSLMTLMNVNNVPKTDRYVMIDDNMYDVFYDSLGDTNAKDFSRYSDAANGIIGKLHSFNIMTRSSVLQTTGADAIKPVGASMGATDNLASLAWQKNSVASAIGSVEMFENIKDALYYGDVYSSLIMAGGRVRRADGLGVYVVEQGV